MSDRKIKLLFLAANPADTQPLDISSEQHAVSEAIRKSIFGASIDLITELAVRPGDLAELLMRHQPDIVHFSGHGLTGGSLVLEDGARQLQFVTVAAFAELIATLRGNIRLVVLNACWSAALAKQIAAGGGVAVGMGRAIDDESAGAFAAGFYQALGYGYTMNDALQIGKSAINVRNLPDAAVPQIEMPDKVEWLRFFTPDPVREWERANPPPTTQATLEWGNENDPIRLMNDPESVPLSDEIVTALYDLYTAMPIHEEKVISSGLSGASVRLVSIGQRSAYAKIGKRHEVEREWWIHKRVRDSSLNPHVPEVLCDPFGPVDGWSLIVYAPAGESLLNASALAGVIDRSTRQAGQQIARLLEGVLSDWPSPTFAMQAQHPQTILQAMLDMGRKPRTDLLHDRMRGFGFAGEFHPLLNFRPGPRGRQVTAPNPIAYLLDEKLWSGAKTETIKPLIASLHGDLHADNVICHLGRDGRPDAKRPPVLIDFAQSTSQGNAFYDFAYLELDILLRTVPVRERDGWDTWVLLSQHLASAALPDENSLPLGRAEQVWEMIAPIRQRVQKVIADARKSGVTDGEAMAEWNWWLASIAAGVMVARRANDVNGQRLAGLFYAAAALNTLLGKDQLDVPIPDECEPYVTAWGVAKAAPKSIELPEDLPDLVRAYLEGVFREKREELVDARQWWTDLTGDLRPHAERTHRGVNENWLDALLRKDAMTGDHWSHEQTMEATKAAPVPNVTQRLMELTRVVLLGEPGAGKTVTLKKLTVAYVDSHLEAHDPARPLPVFVPLAKFDGKTSFTEFAHSHLYNLAEFTPKLNLVWLFDALNEMPRRGKLAGGDTERDLLPEVIVFLQALAAQGDRGRFVLSCRVKDYRDELGAIQDIDKVELRDLTPYQIRDVLTARLGDELAPALWAALKGSDDLLAAWTLFSGYEKAFWDNPDSSRLGTPDSLIRLYLDKADLPSKKRIDLLRDLEKGNLYTWGMPQEYQGWRQARAALHDDPRRLMLMCRNPFTLNVVLRMIELNGIDDLPINRGVLFQKFAAAMLRYELTKQAEVEHISGDEWLAGMERRVSAALEKVAAALQRVEQRTELSRADALRAVDAPDAERLLRVAEAARLIQFGETIRFTHQLLQEYYATAELREAFAKGESPARFFGDTWWEAGAWRETVVILGELIGDPNRVAAWMAPATPEIALSVILDSGERLTLADVTPDTRTVLVHSAHEHATEPDPRGRSVAYRVLGTFDADERPGVLDFSFADGYWCAVPDDGDWVYQNAKHEPLAMFYMAKYPVTYRQFQAFVDAPDGYANAAWWDGLHADGLKQQQGGPGDQAFQFWNHPRERVSWWDAMAFCRWLSAKVGYEVRLPTEEEWEEAARGKDGRAYPYGPDFDSMRGNTSKTGIGQTSAVGIFPQGASPYGILDLSGNVWEWTLTEYSNYLSNNFANIQSRVLRGGSWNHNDDYARAPYRYGRNPFQSFPQCWVSVGVCCPCSVTLVSGPLTSGSERSERL